MCRYACTAPPEMGPLSGLCSAGVMRTHWSHDEFRPLQAEAVAATLAGRDAVLILPTGGKGVR